HDILLFEGQGSLAHPRYSAVTLGLLHGGLPHGLIMCYEAGRQAVHGMEAIPLLPLERLCAAYEAMAALMQPAKVIGVAMNSRLLNDEEVEIERERVGRALGLPVCDVYRHGPESLVDAVLKLRDQVIN
ncbi:MAG: NAD-dependent epimerase/dehydratase family protein, partial [Gammaproteobacteria bacterium]|nr:NAD-dependent epimerase/dehydratase family protein [Gammaproteobacteria bacterium]